MCISAPYNRRAQPVPNSVGSQIKAVATQQNLLLQQLGSFGTGTTSTAPTKGKHAHIVVQHNYHDHAGDTSDITSDQPSRGGVSTTFPLKLHELLDSAEPEGFSDVVSWQPHGRCFVVRKPKEFVGLLPKFFKLSKIASFQRQLNLYGFQRLTRGRDKGGYYHELFLRGRPNLSHKIARRKVKGTGVRARSNPDAEPDFWSMSWINSNAPALSAPVVNQAPPEIVAPTPVVAQSKPAPVSPPPLLKVEEDVILTFGGKSFHFLDPIIKPQERPKWVPPASTPSFGENEMDEFLSDLNLPKEFESLDDDDVFVDMLERIIE